MQPNNNETIAPPINATTQHATDLQSLVDSVVDTELKKIALYHASKAIAQQQEFARLRAVTSNTRLCDPTHPVVSPTSVTSRA